jgi:hypothetical protein
VDVRIGLSQSVRELELEIADEDREKVVGEVEAAIARGDGTLWLTDKKGKTVGLAVTKLAYIELGASNEERRVGFAR